MLMGTASQENNNIFIRASCIIRYNSSWMLVAPHTIPPGKGNLLVPHCFQFGMRDLNRRQDELVDYALEYVFHHEVWVNGRIPWPNLVECQG